MIKQDGYLLIFLRVILSFYYISLLPQRLKAAYYIFFNDYLGQASLLVTAIIVLQLVSTPVVIYLLSVKNKNGWTFSVIGKLIEISYCLYGCWIALIKYSEYSGTKYKIETVLYLLFVAGILVILFYRQTQEALQITKNNRQFAIGVAAFAVFTGIFLSVAL